MGACPPLKPSPLLTIPIKAICVQRPGTGKAWQIPRGESGFSPTLPGQTCLCSTSSHSISRAPVDQSKGQCSFCGDPGTLGSGVLV